MAIDKNLQDAIEALARSEGKSADEVLKELIGDRIAGKSAPKEALARTEPADQRGDSRRDAIERHSQNDFPGTPVVTYDHDPYNETPEQARDRWLAEEAALDDGVHGFGGQSAGGIFGDAPIATSTYDPSAMQRADQRMGSLGVARLSQQMERMERRLAQHERERGQLPGPSQRRLGRGRP